MLTTIGILHYVHGSCHKSTAMNTPKGTVLNKAVRQVHFILANLVSR